MCKLCNSDRNPIIHTHEYLVSDKVTTFITIVKEYIGENPCKQCVNSYKSLVYNEAIKNIDEYITAKLKRHYVTLCCTRAQNNRWYMLRGRESNRPLKAIGEPTFKNILIEKYIRQYARSSFLVSITRDKIRTTKYCYSLKEAQQFKQEILNGNHTNITK